MWKDPIVEETRSRREELARRFNYDIKAIGEALRRQHKGRGKSRSLAHRSVSNLPRHNKAFQPPANPLRGLSAAELGRWA